MRILFIAMTDSIHTVRWLDQIADQGWDLHIFSSTSFAFLPELPVDLTKYDINGNRVPTEEEIKKREEEERLAKEKSERIFGLKFPGSDFLSKIYELTKSYLFPKKIQTIFKLPKNPIVKIIEEIQPDIIHSLETQSAGYQTLEAKKQFEGKFPIWIHSIWGSDIYLFGRQIEHKEKIRETLSNCDYLTCEGERDVRLARSFGFAGELSYIGPGTGGYNLEECYKLRSIGKVSERRSIIVKGYHSFAGRALTAIRALERCADILHDYTIEIFVPTPEVIVSTELLSDKTGIPIRFIPFGTPHKEILKCFGRSRIFLGLSISDGLPNSLLESIVLGCFPIQSYTSLASDWLEDGKNGFLVPPEDPEVVEQAIRKALSEDELINRAAEINWQIAEERLDNTLLKEKFVNIYKSLI